MLKQIEIHNQRFELYTADGGRTWTSSPRSTVEFRRRRDRAFADVKKRFELVDDDAASFQPDEVYEVELSSHLNG